MGCCCSSESDKISQDGGQDERTTLLGNPAANTITGPQSPTPYGTTNAVDKRDEQSALNRILHNTAANIIDVSAIDSQTMEQHEYMDRARNYNQRVATMSGGIMNQIQRPNLLDDVTNIEKVLSSEPVPNADVHMISNASKQLEKSMECVKVDHKENLVVPFGVP